jgi:hypothetical protein
MSVCPFNGKRSKKKTISLHHHQEYLFLLFLGAMAPMHWGSSIAFFCPQRQLAIILSKATHCREAGAVDASFSRI